MLEDHLSEKALIPALRGRKPFTEAGLVNNKTDAEGTRRPTVQEERQGHCSGQWGYHYWRKNSCRCTDLIFSQKDILHHCVDCASCNVPNFQGLSREGTLARKTQYVLAKDNDSIGGLCNAA